MSRNLSLKTTNEAGVLDDFLLVVLFCSEICKRVDDDTEDEVEDDDDDHEEEEHVVYEPQGIERLGARRRPKNVPNTSTIPETLSALNN